ncbi:MAG: AMP-binding protein, partial [Candidatus Sulfotelmatobacter sp.]
MTAELCAGSTTLLANAQGQRAGEIALQTANKNKGRIQELQEHSTSSHTIKSLVRFRNLIEALDAAPANRRFVTAWIDEDERETLTFGEFRRRSRSSAAVLRDHGVTVGDRVVIIMPQGIPAMTTFVGTMMLGAVPTFLAYPNFKIEPSKYRSGLAGVTANLKARVV